MSEKFHEQTRLYLIKSCFRNPECVKEHVEEVRRLVPNLRRPRGDNLLRVLGVSYDDFRKEVWVSQWQT